MSMARASGAAGSATMTFRARRHGEVFQAILNPEITNSSGFHSGKNVWVALPARTDVKVRADIVSDSNTIVTAEFSGLLLDDY